MLPPRPLILTLLLMGLCLLGLAAGAVLGARHTRQNRNEAASVPVYELSDTRGAKVTQTTFLGRVVLVYFGYTFCPDICPSELGFQGRVLTALGADAEAVVPLFITVDPERDTPAHLAEYVHLFDARIIGLTGTHHQLTQAAKAFGAWFGRAKAPTGGHEFYLMDHTSATYVVDRTGHLVATVDSHDTVAQAAAVIRGCIHP